MVTLLQLFNGNRYRLRYKAARMPENYQMAVYASEVMAAEKSAEEEIVVNVFNGNERSVVKMRVRGQTDWIPMKQTPRADPAFIEGRQARYPADQRKWTAFT